MTDTYCVVCGEPWDYWGLRHGDMQAWEVDLFRAGAGCPYCEGEKPAEPWEPESLSQVEFGDEDPLERIYALEAATDGTAPKWEAPEPIVHWTCAGCGVQVRTDLSEAVYDGSRRVDPEPEYHLPSGAPGRQWYHSHPYRDGRPETKPAHTFGEGDHAQHVCEFCLTECAHCGAKVSSTIETSDCYSPGWCSILPDNDCRDVYCVECVEKACPDCYQVECSGECQDADDDDNADE